MICPNCRTNSDAVKDSREVNHGKEVRRRRACERCGYRWTTLEVLAALIKRPTKLSARPTSNSV